MGDPSPNHAPSSAAGTAAIPPTPALVFRSAGEPGRVDLERFVAERYRRAFGAELGAHYPILVGLAGADGAPRAAAGLRFAETGPLFLEQYLDDPADQQVAGTFGQPVGRNHLVEIGSLASVSAPATLQLFTGLARWLAREGRRFAIATARPELAGLLARAGFDLRRLASADPARLPDHGATWGSYYAERPQVFAGMVQPPSARACLRPLRLAQSPVHTRSHVP